RSATMRRRRWPPCSGRSVRARTIGSWAGISPGPITSGSCRTSYRRMRACSIWLPPSIRTFDLFQWVLDHELWVEPALPAQIIFGSELLLLDLHHHERNRLERSVLAAGHGGEITAELVRIVDHRIEQAPDEVVGRKEPVGVVERNEGVPASGRVLDDIAKLG